VAEAVRYGREREDGEDRTTWGAGHSCRVSLGAWRSGRQPRSGRIAARTPDPPGGDTPRGEDGGWGSQRREASADVAGRAYAVRPYEPLAQLRPGPM
jgi:hypothetical protein